MMMLNSVKSVAARLATRADDIVIAGGFALGSALVLWLGGCAQVGQVAAQDATNAKTIAAAVGDSAGEQCWPVLAKTAGAVAAAGNSPGLFTAIEEKRAARLAFQDPACQPIWAGVLAELLKFTPAAPLVP
jgi:hypothetical protein